MRTPVVVYILFFAGLSLLLSLGGWQWRRGMEKAAIEILLEETLPEQTGYGKNHYITVDRSPPDWRELAYRQVRLQGEWRDGAVFLLANRIHRGHAGYEVFSPFRLAGDGSTLLVNRGWLAGTPQTAPHPKPPADAAASGQLYLPEKGFTLGPAYIAPPGGQPQWPLVIQYLDAPALSDSLGTALQPAVVVLDPGHPAAFTRIWRARIIGSARHFGYAAQWWGLAATLLVFGVIWRRRAGRPSCR